MSYTLQFPPVPLPGNIRSLPHVLIAIQGRDVAAELPPNIPLAMLLHFAPKVRHWILPPLEAFGPEYVGINILRPMSARGLSYIVNRMCQLVGLPRPNFDTCPKIMETTQIIEAWGLLELPVTGIESLKTHLVMRLMFGEPIRCIELRVMGAVFPTTSTIMREAAHNFIRSHRGSCYLSSGSNKFGEFHAIQDWIKEDKVRVAFFRELNQQYQLQDQGKTSVVKAETSKEKIDPELKNETALQEEAPDRNHEVLVRGKTLRLSFKQRNELVDKDRTELRYRLRRLKSDDTLRSLSVEHLDLESEDEAPPDSSINPRDGADQLEEKAKKSSDKMEVCGNKFPQGIDIDVLEKALGELNELGARATRGQERRKERRKPGTEAREEFDGDLEGRSTSEQERVEKSRRPVMNIGYGLDAEREEYRDGGEGRREARRDERRKERRKARTETKIGRETTSGKTRKLLDTATDDQLLSDAGRGSRLVESLEKSALGDKAGGLAHDKS
ncbi:hypothetical protein K491DRAFT_715985 [Lophiostoma macrostomum CBS 122681]|uniref:Uncharacterized protein n=1 Tax=Lophiostoma macrostomum CBS 122681 TaxID=1314788 RepID=A0A6A6T8X7_9PLEO|nr:hypothetical protein K491DRAFT_715985 [Lophiostoma macrostomum CBS 122681]